VINKDGNIVQQIARPEGLQNNNVLSVFLDKGNNLWTGLDNGISFIAYNSAVKYIKPGKPDELSGYSVRIHNNELYIATSNGAYVAPLSENAKDLSFSKGDFLKLKNSGGQVWRFDEINHQLLMGHHHGSFLIGEDKAMQLIDSTGTWLYLPTSSVYPSAKVLVGNYNGLALLEYANKKFSNLGEIKGVKESLRYLAIDNENVVWASHPYRGVYRISLNPGKSSFNYELFTEKDGFPSTLRNNVFRVKNRVVFATERGVYEFDADKKKFIPSPLLYSVFGDIKIQYLNEDPDGNIWFCAGKRIGVVSFDTQKNNHQTTYFPELTGAILSGFEFIYPYDKENIFIASTTGIIHLNFKKYFEGIANLNSVQKRIFAYSTLSNLDSVIDQSLSSYNNNLVSTNQTPHKVLAQIGETRILHYPAISNETAVSANYTIPLLMVYAPINRFHILDLSPNRSIVNKFVSAGFNVFIINWAKNSLKINRLYLIISII